MALLRTFTAVETTAEVRAAALRLIDRLRVAQAKVTWTKAANLHFTLKFLGDVPAEKTVDVCRVVKEAVAPFSPFEIVAGRTGAFPSASRPRTIWLGVSEGAEPLELVFQAIERLLKPLGFAPEGRRFQPHMTLGRVRDSSPSGVAQLAELLGRHAEFDAGAMSVGGVTVFSSTLAREGPTYDVLSHADFCG